MEILYWTLVAILGLLQIGDIWTTYTALSDPSMRLKEKNPLIQFFIDRLGLLPGLIVPKGLFVAIVWWLGAPTWSHVAVFALLCGFYIWLVHNNYKLIKKRTRGY